MSRKHDRKIQYYYSYQEDFVESHDQEYTLPEDYEWIHSGLPARAERSVLYFLSIIFGRIYGSAVLHMKIVRTVDMKDFRDTGAVVFGNHTQPLGDVFTPVVVCLPKHCYTVASPSNLKIPFLGSILPVLGAMPIPSSLESMSRFMNALRQRLRENNCLIVYPEAHVWPYYTEIRPFPPTAFTYAVENNVPAFCMTSTYQARKRGRPGTTVYLDGPFYANSGQSKPKQKQQLHDMIYEQMKKRSQMSTCKYIEYRKRDSGTSGGD